MIVLCVGTRPDFIKLGPVAAELRDLGATFRIVNTGQHTDLGRGTPIESDLREAESLGLASDGNVMRWVNTAIRVLTPALAEASVVCVQGDTMTAYAAAHATSSRADVVLAHVEAGVRSHSATEPWPEEGFRVEIDALADWYYAPTTTAYANLVAEGHPVERIRVTGNTVVSALARYTRAAPSAPADHCLVTLHRREFLRGPHFAEVLDALCASARDHAAARFVWPMHPTVAKRLSRAWLDHVPPNLIVMGPLPYGEAACLLGTAFGTITDSGGLVEEAATLGVPSVQLRNFSDRPEAIEAGVSRLEPPTAAGVYAAMRALTTGALPRRPSDAYGSVDAAAQIARHLVQIDRND